MFKKKIIKECFFLYKQGNYQLYLNWLENKQDTSQNWHNKY